MKFIFLFSSEKGFRKYLPALNFLQKNGHMVATVIAPDTEDKLSTNSKRSHALMETKDLTFDVLFCEQEFSSLGVNHHHPECILKDDMSADDVLQKVNEYRRAIAA